MKVRQLEMKSGIVHSRAKAIKLFFVLATLTLLNSCAKHPDLKSIEELRQKRISNFLHLEKPEQGEVLEILAADNVLSQRTLGRTPPWIIWGLNDFFGWNPLGRSVIRSQLCEKKADQWQDFTKISDYFLECEESIKNDSIMAHFQGFQTMTIDLNQELHPLLQRVAFHLPNQVTLKGYLGLRDTRKSRPLVVLRAGVFANVEEMRPEIYLLMQLFEQSHFNFLVLENMSGPDFIHNNGPTSFGGYDEGLQNIWLAKYFKDSKNPLFKLVDSLHFMGLSLGGHGVLFASFLNELNGSPIDSFFGICPLVQFGPTFENLNQSQGFKSSLINAWVDHRLVELKTKMQSFQGEDPKATTLSTAVDFIKKNYTGSLMKTDGIQLPLEFKDSSDFLDLNSFSERAVQRTLQGKKDAQSPVVIFATEEDPLVPYRLNSGWLKKQKVLGAFASVTVQKMKYGSHCTLPDAYQWRPLANLLQRYVAKNSPNFKLVEKQIVQVFDSNYLFEEEDVESSRFYIEWDSSKHDFAIRYQFFVADHPVHLDFTLKPTDLDMDFTSEDLTYYEQRMGVRWLYHNLKVKFDSLNEQMQAHLTWMIAK